MDGMIFAAGLGTRLRPLTDDRPKALVELGGKPLLAHVIAKMREAGIKRIVINVHHFADLIEAFLKREYASDPDLILSDERELLLDTGGGLSKARSYFTPGASVLIHNVDIFTELGLRQVMELHERRQDYATLVTCPASPGRGFRFNAAGCLKGWENNLTGEQKKVDEEFGNSLNYGFCGIHIVSAAFLQNMTGCGAFSIVDEYLRQAARFPVRMFFYSGPFLDLGTPETLSRAERIFSFM